MFIVTITEVKPVMKKERDFVGEDSKLANDGAYHVYEHEEETDVLVYKQRVENLNLVDVIDSVNKGKQI